LRAAGSSVETHNTEEEVLLAKEVISVPGLADTEARGFAQVVAAGDFVFVAGQTAIEQDWSVASTDFEAQARRALENLRAALEAAGSSFEQLVSMTVFFSNASDIPTFSRVRQELLGGSLCASTAIAGASFVIPELLLEIEATAIRSASS
jgi:2-iminobutanoate/2-iminopropanoate deaminase